MAGSVFRRYGAALTHRDFRLLVAAFLVDSIGSWASGVVVAVWAYQRSGSLTLLAALTAASWLPALLVSPVGGVLADRYDRRTVMMACASLCGVVFTGITVTIAVDGPVVVVVLLQVVAAVAGNPYRPAAGALTPEVVDETTMPAANGLFATLEELVVVIGPAIGGLLALVGEAWVGVGINAASFFAAALIARALRVRSRGEAEAGEGVATQFVAGVRALGRTPTAAVLLVFMVLDSMVASVYTVVYIPVATHVGLGPQGYGYLLAGAAVGGVVGALLADRLSARPRLAPVIVGGLLVQALPYAVTAAVGDPAVAIALQAVSGAGMIVVDVLALTAVQREVPAGALSRVLSLLDMGIVAAALAADFVLAALFATLPYALVLVLLGAGVAVLALALSPLLVRADRRAALQSAALADLITRFEAIELLRDLPRPGLERLARAAEVRYLEPGAVLIREGDAADAIYALMEGTLGVESTGSTARGMTLPDVSAPDAVGEIGVLRGIPRTATVTATTAATLYRVAAQDYLDAVTPERAPIAFAGRPALRLARTHPELAGDAA